MISSVRESSDLFNSLQKQVRLLKDFHKKTFEEKNPDYYGVVATSLRNLVGVNKEQTNDPLLLALLRECSSPQLDSLNKYLNNNLASFSNDGNAITYNDLIWFWSSNNGLAHEVSELHQRYAVEYNMYKSIGEPVRVLRNISDKVI